MKKLFFALILISVVNNSYCQDKKINRQIAAISDSVYRLVETIQDDTLVTGYLILLEPAVRQGSFKFYYENGSLKAKGSYTQDLATGVWEYYDEKGALIKRIDFDKTLKYLNTDTTDLKEEELSFNVEEMPVFRGKRAGINDFREYIQQALVYPPYAFVNGTEGRAFVQFAVDSEGKVDSIKLVRSAGDTDLDQEALRIIIESPQWKEPGRLRGKAVPVQFTFPVAFEIK